MRLTVTDIVRESGLCPDTVRKYADKGRIPNQRDANGWRIFTEESINVARKLAGLTNKGSAKADGK